MLYIADQNQVIFQYESGTYGTPLTSGSRVSGLWIGLITDHTPTDEENVQNIRYTGTANRNVGQFINTAKDYEGTLTYHPQDIRMFQFALGSCVDGGAPSPFTHVISESDSDDVYAYTSGTGRNQNFASFTIVDSKKAASDGEHQVRKYKGCVINSLNLTATQGEALTCELNYMAQNLTVGSKSSDIPKIFDEDTSRPYLWSDVKFHKPSGTVIQEVRELSWTVNNNLERRHYDNGSKVVDNLTPLNRDYELTITLDANSGDADTLYNSNWLSGTTFNCMIESVLSADNEQFFIIMSGCKITSFESPSPAEGINEYSITIMPESCNINTDDLIAAHNPY